MVLSSFFLRVIAFILSNVFSASSFDICILSPYNLFRLNIDKS